jgi:hypothetical protein
MGKNSTSPPPIKDSRFIRVFSQCAASKSTDPLKSLFSTTFLNWQAQPRTSKRALRLPPLLDLLGRVDPTHNRSSGFMRSIGLKATQEAIELRALDMKRNSQNQTIRITAGVTLESGVIVKV